MKFYFLRQIRLYNIVILICSFVFLFSGCGLIGGYSAKRAAKLALTEKLDKEYFAEVQSGIGDLHLKANDILAYLNRHTEIEITSTAEISDEQFQIEATITYINPELRQLLLAEVRPIKDEKSASSFNIGDFLDLIIKRTPGMRRISERKTVFRMQKIDGKWVMK